MEEHKKRSSVRGEIQFTHMQGWKGRDKGLLEEERCWEWGKIPLSIAQRSFIWVKSVLDRLTDGSRWSTDVSYRSTGLALGHPIPSRQNLKNTIIKTSLWKMIRSPLRSTNWCSSVHLCLRSVDRSPPTRTSIFWLLHWDVKTHIHDSTRLPTSPISCSSNTHHWFENLGFLTSNIWDVETHIQKYCKTSSILVILHPCTSNPYPWTLMGRTGLLPVYLNITARIKMTRVWSTIAKCLLCNHKDCGFKPCYHKKRAAG